MIKYLHISYPVRLPLAPMSLQLTGHSHLEGDVLTFIASFSMMKVCKKDFIAVGKRGRHDQDYIAASVGDLGSLIRFGDLGN
jgi:hypothetical protein